MGFCSETHVLAVPSKLKRNASVPLVGILGWTLGPPDPTNNLEFVSLLSTEICFKLSRTGTCELTTYLTCITVPAQASAFPPWPLGPLADHVVGHGHAHVVHPEGHADLSASRQSGNPLAPGCWTLPLKCFGQLCQSWLRNT